MSAVVTATNVLIGPFTHSSYAEGLFRLLSKVDAFSVTKVDIEVLRDRLAGDVTAEDPSVVVIDTSTVETGQILFDESCPTSVVVLDPGGKRACFTADNPDAERLVSIIRSLSMQPNSIRSRGDLQALESADVRVLSKQESGTNVSDKDPEGGPTSSSAGRHALESIIEWLDATLGLALLKLQDSHERRSVGGWYVSPDNALAMLGVESGENASESVADHLSDLEQTLLASPSNMPDRLADLVNTFDLSEVEVRFLLLCLAPELDGRYGVAFGVLNDDLTRRRPSLTSLARLIDGDSLGWDLRAMLEAPNSLVAQGLVGPIRNSSGSAVDDAVRLAIPVVSHLLGPAEQAVVSAVDGQLLAPLDLSGTDQEQLLASRLCSLVSASAPCPTLNPAGDTSGWFDRVVAQAGIKMIKGNLSLKKSVNSAHNNPAHNDPARKLQNWIVLCRLYGCALVLDGLETLDSPSRRRVGKKLRSCRQQLPFIAILGDESIGAELSQPLLRLGPPTVTSTERAMLWTTTADAFGLDLATDDARYLAATLPIDRASMKACAELCSRSGESSDGDQAELPLRQRLQQTFYELQHVPLPAAVRRVEASYRWDDLVVSDSVLGSLRTIAAHVAQSGRVFEEWGFDLRMPYGSGLSALFSGPSGTGKTMAARVISADLGVQLLQVDLSKTVSKYIGETEKNLDAAFQAAEQVGAVLLFDEADALFGKRTEVKDSHDRHANVEVAYLLQRIESFPGLAILTTNLKQNIDQAFLRRLRFAIDFPAPTAVEREALWHRSFPTSAPVSSDLDLSFLARRLKLTGGSIQQIALHAAFAASADGSDIGMSHVVAAARQELVKVGMLNSEKTLEGLAA